MHIYKAGSLLEKILFMEEKTLKVTKRIKSNNNRKKVIGEITS